jgi:hypothetical protein
MIEGEKRIVTFMGESGRRIANIIWREDCGRFEVECVFPSSFKVCHMFNNESDAQRYAEEFAFKEKYGTV